MKKKFIIFTILILLALSICGCYLKEASIITKRIQIQPVKLPPGSRVLLCETTPGLVNYEIKRFTKKITLPGIVVVEPPSSKYKGAMLPKIVKKMAGDLSVDMTFVVFVEAFSYIYLKTESDQYELTQERFKGNEFTLKTESGQYKLIQEGFKDKEVIIFRIERSSVYQYDSNHMLMGYTVFSNPPPREIQPVNNNELFLNRRNEFQIWIEKNITAE